eukprot:3254154-Amphidinium_carterae.1
MASCPGRKETCKAHLEAHLRLEQRVGQCCQSFERKGRPYQNRIQHERVCVCGTRRAKIETKDAPSTGSELPQVGNVRTVIHAAAMRTLIHEVSKAQVQSQFRHLLLHHQTSSLGRTHATQLGGPTVGRICLRATKELALRVQIFKIMGGAWANHGCPA